MATLYGVLQILLLMVVATSAIDFNWSSSGRRGQRGKVAVDSSRAGKRSGERRQAKTGESEGEMICGGGANYECSLEECKVSCDDGTSGVLQCTNNAVSLNSNTNTGGTTETKVFCTQGVASSGGSEDEEAAASSPLEAENIIPDSPSGPANPPPKSTKPKRPSKPNKNKKTKPKRPSFPKFPSFPKCFWGTREDGSCKTWKLTIE